MKRIIPALLAAALLCALAPWALADGDLAYENWQTIELDGQKIELPAYALKDASGYDTNYVRLRDLAYLLDGTAAAFDVTWDGAVNILTQTAFLSLNGTEGTAPFTGTQPYTAFAGETRIDGVPSAELSAIVLTDARGGGHTYYKLRDLGKALNFNVDWSSERGVYIESYLRYGASEQLRAARAALERFNETSGDERLTRALTAVADWIDANPGVSIYRRAEDGDALVRASLTAEAERVRIAFTLIPFDIDASRAVSGTGAVVFYDCYYDGDIVARIGATHYDAVAGRATASGVGVGGQDALDGVTPLPFPSFSGDAALRDAMAAEGAARAAQLMRAVGEDILAPGLCTLADLGFTKL